LEFEVIEGTIELRLAKYSQGTGFYTAGGGIVMTYTYDFLLGRKLKRKK